MAVTPPRSCLVNGVVPLSRRVLTTSRLILRRFRDSDARAFARYRSDRTVARFQSWDTPFPLGAALDFVRAAAAADPARPGWFQYAIESRSAGDLVGDVGVHLHENRRQAEIGFTLAVAHQGRGYATEAVGRVLTHLFTDAGLVRVSAECDARNDRSARLLERLGFRREGLRVRNTFAKGEWTDDLLFGLLAEDWPGRRLT
jgi:RimJ/RimL family protein N-acetyltransferase